MADYYDLISPRKRKDRDGNEKTNWHKVGAAFPAREGDAFSLVFDSLPLPDAEGRVMLRMSRPLERDDRGGNQGGGYERQASRSGADDYRRAKDEPPRQSGGGPARYDLDGDDVPFAPEWRG